MLFHKLWKLQLSKMQGCQQATGTGILSHLFWEKAFSVVAPQMWNTLPKRAHLVTTVLSFGHQVNTHTLTYKLLKLLSCCEFLLISVFLSCTVLLFGCFHCFTTFLFITLCKLPCECQMVHWKVGHTFQKTNCSSSKSSQTIIQINTNINLHYLLCALKQFAKTVSACKTFGSDLQ